MPQCDCSAALVGLHGYTNWLPWPTFFHLASPSPQLHRNSVVYEETFVAGYRHD